MAIIVAPRKVIVVYRHERVWLLQLASRSFRNVKEVPFPGFAPVHRKRLAPDWAVLVPRVPPEDDDDWLPLEGVFAKEMSDTILKRTHHRRVDHTGIARDPVQTPQPGLRIKEPQSKAFKEFAILPGELRGGIGIHIGVAAQDFGVLVRGIELRPFLAVFQSLVEMAVMHLPFADEKVELIRRRRR